MPQDLFDPLGEFMTAYKSGLAFKDRQAIAEQLQTERQLAIQKAKHDLDALKLEQAHQKYLWQAQQPGGPTGQATTAAQTITPPTQAPETIAPPQIAPGVPQNMADIINRIRTQPVAAQPMPIQVPGTEQSVVTGTPSPLPDIQTGVESFPSIPGTNKTLAAQQALQAALQAAAVKRLEAPVAFAPAGSQPFGTNLDTGQYGPIGGQIPKEPTLPPLIEGTRAVTPNFDRLPRDQQLKAIGDYAQATQQARNVPVDQQALSAWLANNPGKTAYDFEREKQILTPAQFAQQMALASARASIAEEIKPPTESEKKAQAFVERTNAAEGIINKLGGDVSKFTLPEQVRLRYAPNVLQSQTGQQYLQAEQDFINATLRRESGAAISQAEYDRFGKIYFPQPGDSNQTLDQKANARNVLIQGIKVEAGKAGKRADQAAARTPQAPTGPQVGDVVSVKGGKKIKITKIYPGGGFDGDPVK